MIDTAKLLAMTLAHTEEIGCPFACEHPHGIGDNIPRPEWCAVKCFDDYGCPKYDGRCWIAWAENATKQHELSQ